MSSPPESETGGVVNSEVSPLMRQMIDYCQVGIDLTGQRLLIFAAALALAAYYYDDKFAGILLVLVIASELFDYWLFNKVTSQENTDHQAARRLLPWLYLSTLLSTSLIIAYSIGIAFIQGPTSHFMASFFLFAAALFAAMHSHYVLHVLVTRLLCFGVAFLFIPIRDIVITDAPIQSELWAHLFTSIFVLTFIVDSSLGYLRIYRQRSAQFDLLQEEHEKSKMAYKAKSEFISTMSHELRTPLTSIRGAVGLAQSGKLGELPEKVADVLDVANRNCIKLLKLVDEILDLQSVESGLMKYAHELLDIRQVVSDAVEDTKSFAVERAVSIKSTLPDQAIVVRGDKHRLQQVFENILSNAIKFSPAKSKVLISVEIEDTRVKVLFRDEGIGLSEQDHEKVFDRFTQVDSSDTRKIGGTGLGMNISRQIMSAHDGSISYKKNDGPGTTFLVELERAVNSPRLR
ncbi:HAMP domain-containing sensor histidine kinase [Ruegeria sp. HKCCSP351]|uniref:sensor histidine kinase n=1 Tax=Ruegeria sp. HKCCSP351 TaxID=2794832 RepID=UPI001AE9BDDE|nr:HAMP domain-containing sensor histidine kinase [Ruegeria sp. HKCCSP351]